MAARGVRLAGVLGAFALIVALGAWWLMQAAPAPGDARDAAVLQREQQRDTPGTGAAPLQQAAPRAATPESLVATTKNDAPDVAASASAAAALPGADARFTGRVVDERGAPIAGATVTHVPTRALRRPMGLVTGRSSIDLAWDRLPQTTTDSEGRFAFTSREIDRDPDAPPDPTVDEWLQRIYTGGMPGLVVLHPDFAVVVHACTAYRSVAYDAGDIVLSPGCALTGRLVVETWGADATGRTDGRAAGGVVEGAEVGPSETTFLETASLYGDWSVVRNFLVVRSGADGRFRIGSLQPGKADLSTHHTDFAPQSARCEAKAGEVVDVGDIALEPARHIRGIVLDADGQRLAGAFLLGRNAAHRMNMLLDGLGDGLMQEIGSSGSGEVRVRSDENGAFDLDTLDQVYYDVFANAPGFDADCVRDVQAGSDGVVLRLPAQASLLLTLVDATTHAPLADATASAWRTSEKKSVFGDHGPPLTVLAGKAAATEAALDGEGAGLILVQRAGDDGTRVIASAPGHATTGFALPGVSAGQQLARTLELPRGATLDVRAENEAHEPVADAHVTLSWPEKVGVPLPPVEATSDANGAIRFADLHPGAWTLYATAKDLVDALPTDIQVADSAQPQSAVVTLRQGATLTGLLLDADGAPASQVEIKVKSTAGPYARYWHDDCSSHGHFTFETLPPGPIEISADPGAELSLTLVAGETRDVTLAMRHRPVVRGRVTRAGQPVAGVTVVGLVSKATQDFSGPGPFAFPMNGRDDVKAVTSDTGEYALEFAAPGTHAVQARLGATRSRAVLVATAWDRIELADLELGALRLAVTVTDAATAQPLSGATVSLHDLALDAGGATARFNRAAALDASATTDETGRFVFDGLTPGAFRVGVKAPGYDDAQRDATVPADGTPVELSIALGPATRLLGTVRMASGKPLLPGLRVGFETSAHPVLQGAVTVGSNGAWSLQEAVVPGPCTVKLWRAIAAELGALAAEDVLIAVPVTLAAGESRQVELVIQD